eukprot:11790338-Karenia_brevis.AAC.1
MLQTMGLQRVLPGVRTLKQGVAVYHRFKNYERLAQEHGVLAFELEAATRRRRNPVRLAPRQQQAMAFAEESIKVTMQCQSASTERERDEAREMAWARNKILVIDGPPG